MCKVLIIIPAYNEAGSIKKLIEEIKNKCPEADYIVLNDCSTDNTETELKNIKANYLKIPVNLGIGGAVQLGYKYARENGYDIAVQVDGDGQHDVAYIDSIITDIKLGKSDIVIGSRFIDKEGFQSTGSRRIGIKILSSLIYLSCGCKVKDATSGFRAAGKEYINIFANEYPDDYPEPEVLVSATLNGARIKEIPVIMRERKEGVSSINFGKSVYYMIKVSIAIIISRISLGIRRK